MKIYFLIFSILTTVSASPRNLCNSNDEHYLIVGTCDDKMKFGTSYDVIEEGILLPVPIELVKRFNFPEKTGSMSYEQNIKCIKILDFMNNNNGGCPFIMYGGVGHKDVTIEFRSQKGKDMKFHVQIYIECDPKAPAGSC